VRQVPGKLIWIKGESDGESSLKVLDVALSGPDGRSADGDFVLRSQDIPTSAARIVELPKQGPREVFHPAPRRQFVFVLQGELDVSTSDGSSYRVQPGDWLFADDVESKGHRVVDVGKDNFITLQLAIAGDWAWPPAFPS
jgi:quercetin dioxygenase-like cupin family protein